MPVQDNGDLYLTLEQATRSISKDDYLFSGKEMNRYVGANRIHDSKSNGVGLRNSDRERTLDPAIAHDLNVCRTFLKKPEGDLC